METANPQPGGLFTSVGGALFRRAVFLLGDEEIAVRVAEELFVRFIIHARGHALDERARWIWIYRVVTSHCLRQMPDDARPGQVLVAPSSLPQAPHPDMRALRAYDDATQNIVVLSIVDGLTSDEISEVLGLPGKLVRRRTADAVGNVKATDKELSGEGQVRPSSDPSSHPSSLALDRDRASHAAHVASCARCREIVEAADRLTDRFAREIAPPALGRVAEAIRIERARAKGPRWRRALWMGGGLILVSAIAFLVARPPAPDRARAPFAGQRGALQAKASGIQITVRRGEEVRQLAPDTRLRVGDRLHFRARAERPRYLELRVRGAGGDVRVFPGVGTQAVLVRPGQPLDRDYVVGPLDVPGEKRARKLWIIGLFADNTFALERPPGPDTEVVPARFDIER